MPKRYLIRRARGFALIWRLIQATPWRWQCRDPKCPTAILDGTIGQGLRYGYVSTQQSALIRCEAHEAKWHRGTL